MSLIIPRPLQIGDAVTLEMQTVSDPTMLTLNLVPMNSSDVVCGLNIDYDIKLNITYQGHTEDITEENFTASDLLAGNIFTYRFKAVFNEYSRKAELEIQINESDLQNVEIKHNLQDIQCIMFYGQIIKITKLLVEYA